MKLLNFLSILLFWFNISKYVFYVNLDLYPGLQGRTIILLIGLPWLNKASYLILSYLILSYLVLSCLVLSCLVSSRLVSSRLASPRLASPRLASPRLASPRLASPRLASPRLASPRLASPRLASPRLISSVNPVISSKLGRGNEAGNQGGQSITTD